MYDFGSRLQALRRQRSLTQKQLATRINKSVSAVSGYESNVQIPPTDVMVSIASVLNVSLDYLVGREPECIYSAKNLSPDQREFLDLLFTEFTSPSNDSSTLSPQQIEIIQKLILIFSKH